MIFRSTIRNKTESKYDAIFVSCLLSFYINLNEISNQDHGTAMVFLL